VEITYGVERIAMFLQNKESMFDIDWAPGFTYGDVYQENERQFSIHNYEVVDVAMQQRHFEEYERECQRCLDAGIPIAAYDYVLKCSHAFNLLDARGAISVTDRTSYIQRVRNLARTTCELYIATGGNTFGAGDAADKELTNV
jgi:glycyl-tRNA synthetase alpha chain